MANDASNLNNETEQRLSTIERGVQEHEALLKSGKLSVPITPPAPAYTPIPGLNGPQPARGAVRGSYPANTISDVDFASTHATNAPLRSPIFPPQPAVTPNNLATKQTVVLSHSAAANAIPGHSVAVTSTPVTIPPTQTPTRPTPIGTPPRIGPRPVPPRERRFSDFGGFSDSPTGGPVGPLPVSPRTLLPIRGVISSPAPLQNSPLPFSPRRPFFGSTTLDQMDDGLSRTAILASRTVQNVPYTFRGIWSQFLSYLIGDEVLSGTTIWLCLATNTNSQPGTGNANWQANGSYNAFQGAWSSATSYVIGDEVSYQGNFWYALAANTNSAPTTSNANWQVVGPTNLDNVADGTTYNRVKATEVTTGFVKQVNDGTTIRGAADIGMVVKVGGHIQSTAIVDGRSEGVGTTVQQLNSTGQLVSADQVAADGSTFSRIHTSEITGNNWDASKAGNSHSQAQYISSITGLIRNLIPDSEWRTFNASSPLYWTQVGGSGWSIYNGAGQTGGNLLNFFGTGSPSPVNYVYSKPFYLSAGSYTISFYVNASNVTSWSSFPAAVNDRFLSYTSFGSGAFPTLGVAQRFSQNFTITIKNYAHSTAFSVGDLIIDSNGHGQICSTAGTTGGSSPTWSSVIGNFTNDGSAVWRCHSLTGQVGVSILINVNGTTITNGGALQISGLQLETQNSAGLATAYRVNDGDDTSGTTLIDFASGSHASKVLDNIGDGATYIRPAYVNADHTFHVSTPLVNQSSISGSAGDTTSYTSTTSSITWSWNAFSLYFPDGTTLSVSSGSTQFTGLAANTTYYFDMYIVKSTLTMTIVLSDQNSGQSPSSTQYLVQTVGADGHVVLWTDRTAVSAASGGGSGGGGTCFSGDVKVQTAQGFVRMDALPDEFEIVNLTGHHRATVIRHPVSDETLQVMPCGGLVTSGHLIKQGDGWASASSVFPRESERRGIPLYDIHVDTGMPENMHYILENGFIAHNKSRVSCFDAATRVRTPEGWVRFDDLSPRDRVQTADGIFDAVVFSHATNGKGRFCVLPSGSIATDDHLVKLVPAEAWKHADELFPVTDEMPFKVFNLAVVGSDYYETEDVLAHDRDMEGA